MITLMNHQKEVLAATDTKNKVAYYLDMGLGKTYVGSEKAAALNKNILVICQKSKVQDWVEHFRNNYTNLHIYDLTLKHHAFTDHAGKTIKVDSIDTFLNQPPYNGRIKVGVINYELAWRRKELGKLTDFTLMLDESSLIQNEVSKRAKFILNKLNPSNVILLSGTPVNGKYEQLWSQCHLLGWEISKKLFYRQYLVYSLDNDGYPVIVGYKNVERLKNKLREYGAVFMKTEEVLDLPRQTFIPIRVPETDSYKFFKKHSIVTTTLEGHVFKDDSDYYGVDITPRVELVGDTTLTKLLYSRMLCSTYNKEKLEAFSDLLDSTNDRLVVFYNFNDELRKLEDICIAADRPVSIVNGQEKDLSCYEEYDNAVVLVQYQAGAYGLNLQKANKVIYFSPPLSSEQFEQSKKRIHRIGQNQPCFYYKLITGIEHHIYQVLDMRKDYTDDLFKEGAKNDN